jgi:hypothetical protein
MPKVRCIEDSPPPFAQSIRRHHAAFRAQVAVADKQRIVASIAEESAAHNEARARETLVALNGRLVAAGLEIDDRVEVGGHLYQLADGDDSPAIYLGAAEALDLDHMPSLEDDLAERAFEYGQMTHPDAR